MEDGEGNSGKVSAGKFSHTASGGGLDNPSESPFGDPPPFTQGRLFAVPERFSERNWPFGYRAPIAEVERSERNTRAVQQNSTQDVPVSGRWPMAPTRRHIA